MHNVQNQNGLDVAFQSIVNIRQEWQPALLLERANIPLVDSDNIDWIGLHRRDTKINEMITWVTSKPESLWRATSFVAALHRKVSQRMATSTVLSTPFSDRHPVPRRVQGYCT